MPTRSLKPSYCLDKSSGRAFVTIDGHRKYLGKHNTQESHDAYDRAIGEWIAAGRPRGLPSPARAAEVGLTVDQVIAAFWAHAQVAYPAPPVREKQRPKGELGNYWDALRPLRRLYGPTPASKFGPLALEAVRQHMIELKWCRAVINRQISRLRHVFRWAVSKEHLQGETIYRLDALPGLRYGRSAAREADPVKPVPDVDLQPVVDQLPRRVGAMVQLQLLTGMRPGEVCQIRTADLDTTGEVWVYSPPHHKTTHHGHVRQIFIGPKAQDLLRPFLKTDLQACIFSPAEAEAERREALTAARETPRHLGNAPGTNRKESPRRRPAGQYTTASYRRAIQRACDKAFDADGTRREAKQTDHRWHPHQLRHNAATLLRRLYGMDAARATLGHRSTAVTEIYAEMDGAKVRKIMAEIG